MLDNVFGLSFFKLFQFLTLSWRRPLSYKNQSIDLRTGFYMKAAPVTKGLRKLVLEDLPHKHENRVHETTTPKLRKIIS